MTASLLPLAGGLAALAILLVALIAISFAKTVQGFASPDWSLEPLDTEDYSAEFDRAVQHAEWADANGFEWIGMYTLQPSGSQRGFAAAWAIPAQPHYFTVYLVNGKEAYDFVTIFDEARHITVTTGSTRNSMLTPSRPPTFKQAFEGRSHDDRYALHQQAVRAIEQAWAIRPIPISRPFEDVFTDALRRWGRTCMKGVAWPLRGVFGFFVGRHLYANRPIRVPDRQSMPSTA